MRRKSCGWDDVGQSRCLNVPADISGDYQPLLVLESCSAPRCPTMPHYDDCSKAERKRDFGQIKSVLDIRSCDNSLTGAWYYTWIWLDSSSTSDKLSSIRTWQIASSGIPYRRHDAHRTRRGLFLDSHSTVEPLESFRKGQAGKRHL